MRRVLAAFGSVIFLVLAPGTVAGLVPWWISRWRFENPAIWWFPLRIAGGVLAAAGLAVLAIILGQALIFGNARLLGYGALIWLAFHVFVVVYEEPTLRATFGAEYERFCRDVSRWVPRG